MALLETKTIATLTKGVADKLKDVLVIRERRWNRRDRNISWFGAAAFGVALVIRGYSWRAVQDRDPTTARGSVTLRRCRTRPPAGCSASSIWSVRERRAEPSGLRATMTEAPDENCSERNCETCDEWWSYPGSETGWEMQADSRAYRHA